MKTIAWILLGCALSPVFTWAQEPLELPAFTTVKPPLWDLDKPVQPISPGDDFLREVLNRESQPTTTATVLLPGRQKQSRELTVDFAKLNSSLDAPDLRELREIPALSRDWNTEQSLNVPLTGRESLFMFGTVAGNSNVDQTQNEWRGRTGVGVKWAPFSGGELQVRTGPVVKYMEDTQTRAIERSQLSVEMQAKLALFGPLQLKYAGEALPSFAQAERHQLLQDLKLALPLGTNREVNVGARYRWEDALTPTPWQQRAELYMGVKFQH